jgi:hypothetical protein
MRSMKGTYTQKGILVEKRRPGDAQNREIDERRWRKRKMMNGDMCMLKRKTGEHEVVVCVRSKELVRNELPTWSSVVSHKMC